MRSLILLCTLVLFISVDVAAQNVWTQVADFAPGNRLSAASFVIDGKAYVTTGRSYDMGVLVYYNDTWEYDPVTDTWSQKANFPGIPRDGAAAFVINDKAYVGTGGQVATPPAAHYKDFYEYNATANTWTQKSDFAGTARYLSTFFALNGKGYIGMGHPGPKIDFWEYDPFSDTWVQKSSFPGGPRQTMAFFTINGKGYAGTGNNSAAVYKDFWEYNPITDQWIQKANFPGEPRLAAVGFSLNGKGYMGTGALEYIPSATDIVSDMWEYHPQLNYWEPIDSFGGGKRHATIAFVINDNAYLGTGGSTFTTYDQDIWKWGTNLSTSADLEKNYLKIYPNPASEILNLELDVQPQEEFLLKIYNIAGQLVDDQPVIDRNIQVDISNYQNGIYFYTISANSEKHYSGSFEVIK